MFNRLTNIVLSPYILALIISVAAYFIFFPEVEEYELLLNESYNVDKKDGQSIYADLDGDSISEYITSFNNVAGIHAIKVMDGNRNTIEQYNLSGKHPLHDQRIIAGDYDGNGYSEIYCLSLKGDSILLNVVDPLGSKAIIRKDIFVDTVWKNKDNKIDFKQQIYELIDMDKDGYKDLVFSIKAGFSLYPRKIYLYNMHNDSLLSSPLSGTVLHNLVFQDIDNDGFPEIFGSTCSTGNMKPRDTLPYPDTSAWFMVLDHTLNYTFKPIEFPGFRTHVTYYPVKTGNGYLIILLRKCSLSGDSLVNAILYDLQGKKIREKAMNKNVHSIQSNIYNKLGKKYPGRVFFNKSPYEILMADTSLHTEPLLKLPTHDIPDPFIFNINSTPEEEYILHDIFSGVLWVGNIEQRNNMVSSDIKLNNPFNFRIFGPRLNGNDPPELFVQLDSSCYLFSYAPKPFYAYRHIRFIVLYLIVLVFIFLIRHLYDIQIKKRQENEQQLAALQLKTIRSQINPHFIFNSLNSVSHAVFNEDKTEAYTRIVQLSNLMRQAISDSKKMDHSLEEELDFIRNFLELESSMLGDKLEYEIRIPADIQENIAIPKMMLQTFVENAIKHGIALRGYGKIMIYTESGTQMLRIIIEDNGIGRKKARELNTVGTGTGLEVVGRMIELYKKLKGTSIHYEIVDLHDGEGECRGTRVVVEMDA